MHPTPILMEFRTFWYQTTYNLSAEFVATGVTNFSSIFVRVWTLLNGPIKLIFFSFKRYDICKINIF